MMMESLPAVAAFMRGHYSRAPFDVSTHASFSWTGPRPFPHRGPAAYIQSNAMTRLILLAAWVAIALSGSAPAQGWGPGSLVFSTPQSLALPPAGNPPDDAETAGYLPVLALGGGAAASTGEREIRALARAYPGQIAELAQRDGDWSLRLGERWFRWAEGRLLPEGLPVDRERYSPYRFYDYPYRLPPLPHLDPAARRRLKDYLEQTEAAPPERHEGFLGALYDAGTRVATEAHLVTVVILGRTVRVHDQVAGPLEAVAVTLEDLQARSGEVRRFFEGIEGFAGYNWRPIAGTQSRSLHSYAAAVDLVPRNYGGKHAYWRWAMDQTEQWYALSYGSRWMVPEAVVRAFEQQGFIWGGKWFFFDTMHFEYRPEMLLLSSEAGRFGFRPPTPGS